MQGGWPWAHCGVHLLCHIGKAVFFQIYTFQCFFRGINKHFKSSFVTDLITGCHHSESISNSWQWETPCHEQYARGTLEKRKRSLKRRSHSKHNFLGSLPPRGWTYRKMCKKNILSSIHSFVLKKLFKDCAIFRSSWMPAGPAAMPSLGSGVPALAMEAPIPWSSILVKCWVMGEPPRREGFSELYPAEEHNFHLIL